MEKNGGKSGTRESGVFLALYIHTIEASRSSRQSASHTQERRVAAAIDRKCRHTDSYKHHNITFSDYLLTNTSFYVSHTQFSATPRYPCMFANALLRSPTEETSHPSSHSLQASACRLLLLDPLPSCRRKLETPLLGVRVVEHFVHLLERQLFGLDSKCVDRSETDEVPAGKDEVD